MPVHDGSRSNQDERLPPPRPERSQRHPEQLVHGSQSSARPLRVQSEQLPTESQVFEGEVLARAKRAEDPPEEMPERHNHDKNNIGTIRIQLFCQVIHFAGVRRFGEAQLATVRAYGIATASERGCLETMIPFSGCCALPCEEDNRIARAVGAVQAFERFSGRSLLKTRLERKSRR